VIDPDQVDALTAALRTRRDRAMVEAMLLGGLRRCEVLGLRLEDVRPGERRLFIADGKGGHQRIIPVSKRFFATLVGKRAGIEHLTCHQLRHTCFTRLLTCRVASDATARGIRRVA